MKSIKKSKETDKKRVTVIPIISTPTGFWGGDWTFVVDPETRAFKYLKQHLEEGLVKYTPHYGQMSLQEYLKREEAQKQVREEDQ